MSPDGLTQVEQPAAVAIPVQPLPLCEEGPSVQAELELRSGQEGEGALAARSASSS